jgi:hypothetical protein
MCEKDWIDVLGALLTPIIAIIAVYIAYKQWDTEEKKRKQDMFDKRYAFFKQMWNMYSGHIQNPNLYPPTVEVDLLDYSHEAEFLFGKDIVDHIFKIPEKQNPSHIDYDWFSEPFKKYMKL